MKRLVILAAALALPLVAGAQSKSFRIGKWTEVRNAVVKELNRSYVDSLPVDRMQRAAIDAMLGELDPYTIYIPAEEDEDLQMMVNKSYGGIGAVIYKPEKDGYVFINEPYEGSPAARAGLQCGDRIVAIDGESVIGLDAGQSSAKMKGNPGTDVTFHIIKVRSGEEKDVTITREKIHLPDIEYAGILDDDITGYISQTGFTAGVGEQVRKTVAELKRQGAERIFLDLRGNGGGLLNEAASIVSIFVPKGSLVVSEKGNGNVVIEDVKTEQEPLDTEIPLYVLVDSGSASASEIVAGALQDYDRAVIMGRRTYGKGLVQVIRPLPYSGKMKVTVAKYYTPSGRCVQAIDYSHRNEDGSVGYIPDSLTREFKTVGGRTVRDGGGITPDIQLCLPEYSRLTYSLVAYGVIEHYMLEYVKTHESIPEVRDFHFSDDDYEDFIRFALDKEFDFRSGAKTYFDRMREELRRDKLETAMSAQLDSLENSLNMSKEDFLRMKKTEIIPFIEQEIVQRYRYQKAGALVRMRYDDQLKEALNRASEK